MLLVKLSGCGLTRNSNYIPINLFQLNFGDVYNRSSRKCLLFGNFVQFISSLFHKFIFVLEGEVKNSVEWRESNYSAYWSTHFLQLNLFFSKILNVNYYMHTCMYLLFYLKKNNPKKVPFSLYGLSTALQINLKCFLSIIKPQLLLQRLRQLYQVRHTWILTFQLWWFLF